MTKRKNSYTNSESPFGVESGTEARNTGVLAWVCELLVAFSLAHKAKSRRRDVPLSRSVVKALLALRARSKYFGPEDLVFASGNGTPLNERNLLRRVLKPAGHKLGIPCLSRHVFRHTHATLGEEIGMALSDRQAQMGHGDVRMTLHYTHSDLDRRRQSIEAMSDRLTEEPVTVAKLKGFESK
jgi:integrase